MLDEYESDVNLLLRPTVILTQPPVCEISERKNKQTYPKDQAGELKCKKQVRLDHNR